MNVDSPPPALRRKTREKEERRQRILAAAESVFAQHGYHDASLTDIAERADFAVGTLYLYFKDKSDLYGCLIEEKLRRLVEEVEGKLTADGSPTRQLRAVVQAHFRYHDLNRQFFEIFLHQHQTEDSPLHRDHWQRIEDLKKHHLTLLEACLQRGQAAGEFRAGDPHLFAVAFLGIILQMVRQWIREKPEGRLEDCADFAADCFLHGASPQPRLS